MLINELPDDCLLTIFDYIQDLTDLINCFKVCEKWSNVIVGRTKRVKYLDFNHRNCSPRYFCNYVNRPIDVTCLSKLFPNLRIADLTSLLNEKEPIEDIVKLIRDLESLKGIIYDRCSYLDFVFMPENANLEMFFAGYIDSRISGIYENVKQLDLRASQASLFESVAHCFPNLERLRISNSYDRTDYSHDGPVMANLKIAELGLASYDSPDVCSSFLFIDSCPALQSAHIRIHRNQIVFNDSIKHANLQDLVILSYGTIEWNELSRCMSKYPNLKHLSLQGTSLKDEHIKYLILILPKLTLLDVRKSHGVTQEAADHVRDYCKQHGRSIKFYFKKGDKQIESDWPQILNPPDKICRGFDFMEHCFFKFFYHLPHFLDPIDD